MSVDNKVQKFDQENWYIIINNQTRGPLSLRDLDVLLRTSEINSFTYAWKNGMSQWKLMNDIPQIKDSILESSKEMFQIEKKKGQTDTNKKENGVKSEEIKIDQSKQSNAEQQDQTIENQDQNVLTILETTVENLLQKTFHQTEQGKWSIYDEEKGQWIQQEQQPTEKMAQMKKHLLTKLKNQLFFGDKNNAFKRKKPNVSIKEEEQRQLTKQQLAKKQKNRKKAKRAAEKKKEKWYQARVNTFVYISGLPLDVTEDQLKHFCSKAGVIRFDLNSGKDKIKLYKDEDGLPKGDAAVSYARPQSVEIALEMLNGNQIRSGFSVKVQKAEFHQKDQQYVPRESKKQSKIQKIQAKKMQQKIFGWNEDGQEDSQGLRIVILKNVFGTQIVQNDDQIERVKKEIKKEVEKCGQVQRIRYYETHPDGVVQVKFKQAKSAQDCIESLNQKKFEDRQLECEYWDGETDYKHNSISLMLQNQRLNKFVAEDQNQDKKQKPLEVEQTAN